jgi:hypothetical protein
MTNIEMVKNRLIDRILVTGNRELLEAAEKLLSSDEKEDIFHLSSYQIEMLMMSEQDIKEGNLISENELKSIDNQ